MVPALLIAGGVIGFVVALAIAVLLLITLVRISGVLLVQWRDLLSIDRWAEVTSRGMTHILRPGLWASCGRDWRFW